MNPILAHVMLIRLEFEMIIFFLIGIFVGAFTTFLRMWLFDDAVVAFVRRFPLQRQRQLEQNNDSQERGSGSIRHHAFFLRLVRTAFFFSPQTADITER